MAANSHKNNDVPVTISNGYWFYFDVDGHNIAVFGSTWSGRETVFVEDEIVSNFRNLFRLEGRHVFSINNADYTISLKMENLITGQLCCTLRKGKQVIGEQRKGYILARTFLYELLILVLAGYALGNITSKLFVLIHSVIDK